MAEEMRIAVVGLGGRANNWLDHLLAMDGYRITAVCDTCEPLHEPFLAKIEYRREVTSYRHYDEVLADSNVDAIALCVRCHEQGAMAAQGLEAGKHVNSEVPAAHTIEDCWRIVLAAERTSCVYQLAEQVRYWGFIDAWRDLVSEGKLGKITYAEGQYLGYYGTHIFFRDPQTGRFFTAEESRRHAEAKPTWFHMHAPIHYLPHELSPMLKILDDRVVEVTAMSTRTPSYSHPEIEQPDLQVALMKTEKDTVLRLLVGFTQPRPHGDHHWYQFIGTRGSVEWRRRAGDLPRLWLAESEMQDFADADWRFERSDAPLEARDSGHHDADYYVHAAFRDAVLEGTQLEFDVYRAVETAAPAIRAAESIRHGTKPIRVPGFRPGAGRPAGDAPKELPSGAR
jgi:predicted dehydrogenase